MSAAAEHIARWESAGLIDAATAERLRAATAEDDSATQTMVPTGTAADSAAPPGPGARPTTVAAVFGPAVQVVEAFAYLGIGFLAAAWTAFLTSQASRSSDPDLIYIIGTAVSALAFTALGTYLLRGDAHWRRGAGVAWLAATANIGAAAWFTADAALGSGAPMTGVLSSGAALLAAAVFRRAHPSLVLQFALLASLSIFAASLVSAARDLVFGVSSSFSEPTSTEVAFQIVLEAAWWAIWAAGIGLIGLREARAVDDAAAQRRASLSRLWAGLLLVIGVSSALTRSAVTADGDYQRVIEPWVVDAILVVIAAILIERAFRRGSGAFLVTGAFALIVALTDFNASYLTSSIEAGLLVEGVILLGVGFGASRLRPILDQGRDARAAGTG